MYINVILYNIKYDAKEIKKHKNKLNFKIAGNGFWQFFLSTIFGLKEQYF